MRASPYRLGNTGPVDPVGRLRKRYGYTKDEQNGEYRAALLNARGFLEAAKRVWMSSVNRWEFFFDFRSLYLDASAEYSKTCTKKGQAGSLWRRAQQS